ncbi:MAG: histidine--tRNA ligase [Alphaproteobacteria bacterium CG11_big_fil_rev_8_21_14_0_20_44_7]|nr:MAG: histidine--tRNA ligase [Alphaproteobacteria bacterium CG11_big_fil_rev_8_21_14_0_20_44_7]
MSKLQPVRGTHDLLPDEFEKFFRIQQVAREITSRYGFREMATPIFEFTDVFARTMGETSDVVNKEMYSFEDRGAESLTLRPEFTAGMVRSVISNGLQQNLPLKLFTTGAVFRYERPQKGRQRQFHQLNVEHFGDATPLADAEAILMAAELLKALGISSELHINSLGDAESRALHREALVSYLGKYKNDLSEDSKTRLEKNPLRILDSKDEGDKKICENAPKLADSFNDISRKFFDDVQNLLAANNQALTINHNLVRGLDYYNHTVFEFKSAELGAQDTILAGGRYDGLVKQMGGQDIPAIGWGAGLERLLLLAEIKPQAREIYAVIAGNDELKSTALQICQNLRAQGKMAEIIAQTNIGKAMKKANNMGASFAVIYGEDEAKENSYTLKNLNSGEQIKVNI